MQNFLVGHIILGFLPMMCPTFLCKKHIGRPKVTKDDIPANFLRHYPSLKSGKLNVSELARVCDMSRTTVYKYVSLLAK